MKITMKKFHNKKKKFQNKELVEIIRIHSYAMFVIKVFKNNNF